MATDDRSDSLRPVADLPRRDPLGGLGYTHASSRHSLTRIDAAAGASGDSVEIAEEVPIALVYNGRSHVVVMGTPADLEDLALGFTLTESIVDHPSRVERVHVVKASHGIELQIQIPATDAARLEQRARGLVARTGCGLCGVETIGEAMRVPARVTDALRIDANALWRAGAELAARQSLNNRTNTVHAAAWATRGGELPIVREDVGRHNALDKVLGALALGRARGDADHDTRDVRDGFAVVTSRASYEMVQKTAACGIELLAAISRPTGLAIRFADAAGLTLVGLLRGRTANVYTRPDRITMSPSRNDV